MAAISNDELLKLKHEFDDVYQGSTTPELFELCRAGSNLVDAIRAQRTALVVWQFQAAGAARALQRLMDAAQAMREAQTAFERLVADDHESIFAVLRRAAKTMGDAEDAFDDLLSAYRREMNFVK